MLKTEMRNEKTTNIDKMSTYEMLKIINEENYNAVKAVEEAIPQIEDVCEAVVRAFKAGGRLFYIGCGTSGRMGVVDAAECPPTFGVPSDMVVGIIAGGLPSMAKPTESKEDDEESGINDIKQYNLTKDDIVIGISVAGGAKYVIGALKYASQIGCVTAGITSNKDSLLDKVADYSIVTDTGAEVVTGSTRMKAGTAQKIVLNMISTISMIKMGNVYQNLMINLRPQNIKLKKRMISIVSEILDCDFEKAEQLLEKNDWKIRDCVEKKD